MIVRASFRYRIYPTAEQASLLEQWESALRFLWNIAHEQRLLGIDRPREERIYPSAYDQQRELTLLRAELPWLAAVPSNVCGSLLVKLDRAWRRCFDRLSRVPRWKGPIRRRANRPACR